MFIRTEQEAINEGPREITVDNVIHWSRHSKELNGSQRTKALKFVKYDCIKYIGDKIDLLGELKEKYKGAKHIFLCLPLNKAHSFDFFGHYLNKIPYEADYNFSEYIIYKDLFGNLICNCQGFVSKEKKGELIYHGANCSHCLALFYAFTLKKFGNKGNR